MYTKGEWKVRSGFRVTSNEGLMYIADCYPYHEKLTRPKTIEAEANAHLIAAAPDCYEGLKDALREICRMCVRLNPQHQGCTSCKEMERSRLPLAKAEEVNHG